MANAFIALCYAEAKKAGKDISKMSVNEVIEWYNKNKAKGDAKQKIKELILEKKNISYNKDIEKYYVERVDTNNHNELKSKIEGYIKKISVSNVEHNIVIDKKGNVYEKTGTEDYVEDMGVNLEGAIDLHNHLEDVSFGEDDFNSFREHVGTTFIVTTPKFIHKLKVLKEIDKPYNYFYIRGLKKEDEPINQQHNIMEYLKNEGYIEYERILRKT